MHLLDGCFVICSICAANKLIIYYILICTNLCVSLNQFGISLINHEHPEHLELIQMKAISVWNKFI